jgi:hypothetical protein
MKQMCLLALVLTRARGADVPLPADPFCGGSSAGITMRISLAPTLTPPPAPPVKSGRPLTSETGEALELHTNMWSSLASWQLGTAPAGLDDDRAEAERSSKLDCRGVGPRDECIEYSSAAPKLEARAPAEVVGGGGAPEPSTMAKKSAWLKLEPRGLCCRDELIE